ncbi:MAG: hypothetical protein WAT20_04275 [Ferruginibacter sp.]
MKPIFFFGFFMLILSASLCAQNADTAFHSGDSSALSIADSARILKKIDSVKAAAAATNALELKNKLLNSEAEPVSLAVQHRNPESRDAFF